MGNVRSREAMRRQKRIDVGTDALLGQTRNVSRQQNAKAIVPHLPPQDFLSLWIEERARAEDARSARVVSSSPGKDERRATVPEQAGGNGIGDRSIVALKRERAQLDRNEERDVIGKGAQIVRRARGSGGARDATQAEDGRALHVGPQAQAIDEPRVDARGSDARHRDEKDVIDVPRLEARLVE